VAGTLPSRSGTGTCRELLAIREGGYGVVPVSIGPPDADLGDPGIDALRDEAVVLRANPVAWAGDALRETLRHPLRTLVTLGVAVCDAVWEPHPRASSRASTLVHAVEAVVLARRLRARRVTHVHALKANLPASLAMYAARQMGVPFSFMGAGEDLFAGRLLLQAKLRRAAFAACSSEWHREFYRGRIDLPPERLPLVRRGVDMTAYSPTVREHQDIEILGVGRLAPEKGFDTLLAALSRLKRQGRAARCVLVGDGPERARLERMRDDMGLGDCVEFEGAVSNDSIPRLMRRAKIVILPFRRIRDEDLGRIPMVLLEAMACGACVITGDLPAIRELVHPMQTGILVRPGDVESLAAALDRVLGDLFALAAFREAGRRRVEDEFDLAVNVARLKAAVTRARRGPSSTGAREHAHSHEPTLPTGVRAHPAR